MYRRLHHWLKQRSFSGLLALYEANYDRLLRLVPEPDFPFDAGVSRSSLDRDLHLRVLQRSRYTVTFNLTYQFKQGEGAVLEPDLDIRVYRDAMVAEALRVGPHAHCAVLRDLDRELGPMLEGRWGRNLLLGKWLDYLLSCGHGFTLAGRPRHAAGTPAATSSARP